MNARDLSERPRAGRRRDAPLRRASRITEGLCTRNKGTIIAAASRRLSGAVLQKGHGRAARQRHSSHCKYRSFWTTQSVVFRMPPLRLTGSRRKSGIATAYLRHSDVVSRNGIGRRRIARWLIDWEIRSIAGADERPAIGDIFRGQGNGDPRQSPAGDLSHVGSQLWSGALAHQLR